MKYFQHLKIARPTSSEEFAARNRTARWALAAAVAAAFFAWLATSWVQYPTQLHIRSNARTVTEPTLPTASICLLADKARRPVTSPIATCPERRWA
jgi:hypothetical protein